MRATFQKLVFIKAFTNTLLNNFTLKQFGVNIAGNFVKDV